MEFLIFIVLISIRFALSDIKADIRKLVDTLEKIKRGY